MNTSTQVQVSVKTETTRRLVLSETHIKVAICEYVEKHFPSFGSVDTDDVELDTLYAVDVIVQKVSVTNGEEE